MSRVVGMVASPRPDGRTAQLVRAALEGARTSGADVELLQLAEHRVSGCQDCDPWVCTDKGRCRQGDEAFEVLARAFNSAQGVVVGTPVYWGAPSTLFNNFATKLQRVWGRRPQAEGNPALGISLAGGTGGGLISGLRPLYNSFRLQRLRALEPLPVTRYDFQNGIDAAYRSGRELGSLAGAPRPLEGLERELWYDDLRYLSLGLLAERLIQARRIVNALDKNDRSSEAMTARQKLVQAESAIGAGDRMRALPFLNTALQHGLTAYDLEREPNTTLVTAGDDDPDED